MLSARSVLHLPGSALLVFRGWWCGVSVPAQCARTQLSWHPPLPHSYHHPPLLLPGEKLALAHTIVYSFRVIDDNYRMNILTVDGWLSSRLLIIICIFIDFVAMQLLCFTIPVVRELATTEHNTFHKSSRISSCFQNEFYRRFTSNFRLFVLISDKGT